MLLFLVSVFAYYFSSANNVVTNDSLPRRRSEQACLVNLVPLLKANNNETIYYRRVEKTVSCIRPILDRIGCSEAEMLSCNPVDCKTVPRVALYDETCQVVGYPKSKGVSRPDLSKDSFSYESCDSQNWRFRDSRTVSSGILTLKRIDEDAQWKFDAEVREISSKRQELESITSEKSSITNASRWRIPNCVDELCQLGGVMVVGRRGFLVEGVHISEIYLGKPESQKVYSEVTLAPIKGFIRQIPPYLEELTLYWANPTEPTRSPESATSGAILRAVKKPHSSTWQGHVTLMNRGMWRKNVMEVQIVIMPEEQI